MSADATDAEKLPLHAEEGKAEAMSDCQDLQKPDDSMSYDARKILSFDIFSDLSGTVWTKKSLWMMMASLLALSIAVSITVAYLVKEPEKLEVDKFQKISLFLKVIVGLLLGFFLSNSVERWYACSNGFLELFDAIRMMQMQLNALGVPKDRVHLCLRYCVVSAHCLNNDLVTKNMPKQTALVYKREKWDSMITNDANSSAAWNNPKASLAHIYQEERMILEKLEDSSQTLWVWVTSLVTRLSQDGEIPDMPTPTYGRIIGIAESAYNGIRTVRASVSVQPPYVHVQMMAALVNVNNFICAVSFGMSLGVTVSTYLARAGLNPVATAKPSSGSISEQLQDLIISFILATIGPFLYQALLEVAVCICQPFSDAGNVGTPGRIPVDRLLYNLEMDLRDAELMSQQLPWWDQPHFKVPAPADKR